MTAHSSPPARPARSGSADWETFPHGADIGVRGFGDSPAEAFMQAAIALTAVITDPDLVRPLRRIEIACSAPDREILLVDWLNRLITAMATEGMLFGRYEVEVSHDTLKAYAYGEAIDPARHTPAVEVKGATFTELQVAKDPDGRWRAQCVVDV